jgi:hypothetical protein
MDEMKVIELLLHGSTRFNHRQALVLGEALRDATEPFTINAQARRNRVVYETARTDLITLESLGLLTRQNVGNKFVFRPVADLADRLRHLD